MSRILYVKKRLEKYKKVIESDVKDMTTQEKTANDNDGIKKKAIKKRTKDKKAIKEKQRVVAEKAMNNASKRNIDIEENLPEEEPEESKIVITKEERAERFKRLHTIAQDLMKKRNE